MKLTTSRGVRQGEILYVVSIGLRMTALKH